MALASTMGQNSFEIKIAKKQSVIGDIFHTKLDLSMYILFNHFDIVSHLELPNKYTCELTPVIVPQFNYVT